MKWPAFEYARANTLDDLWQLKLTSGAEAKIIAGGQSLLATLAFRLSQPSVLIDVSRIEAMKGIADIGGSLRLGALTRHVELERSALIARHVPLLSMAAPLIAHPAIRNRGTLGGSLAFADPAAELPACLVALDATIVVASSRGERRVSAPDFFTGLFETALEDDEIILAVEIAKQRESQHTTVIEIARRSGDYAMAGLACSLDLDSETIRACRLVYFGVGTGPVLARQASAALISQLLTEGTIAAAQSALEADLDPPDDLHGPAAMKRHLARVLTARALTPLLTQERAAA